MVIPSLLGKSSSKGLPILEFVFLIAVSVFYINFLVQAQYQLVAPFIFLGYVIYCYTKEPTYRKLITNFLLCLLVLTAMYAVLTDINTISAGTANRLLKQLYSKFAQYLLVFFPVIMYVRVKKIASRKQTLILLGVIIFNAVVLIRGALAIAAENDNILHSMNADSLENAGVNIQGFSFVYAFTFIVITCIMLIKNSTQKWLRTGATLLLLYSVYFLLKAQFALSIVTTFISLMYFYYTNSRNKQQKVFVTFVLFFVILLSPLLLSLLMMFTAESAILHVRLQEIYNAITFQSTGGETDMGERLSVYGKCIEYFLRSPLVGNRSLPFNGHSTFLSAFANVGFFGGYLICKMFHVAYKVVESSMSSNLKYFRVLMCQIILMGLTNPIHSSPSNFIMLWFLCPLMINLYITRKGE